MMRQDPNSQYQQYLNSLLNSPNNLVGRRAGGYVRPVPRQMTMDAENYMPNRAAGGAVQAPMGVAPPLWQSRVQAPNISMPFQQNLVGETMAQLQGAKSELMQAAQRQDSNMGDSIGRLGAAILNRKKPDAAANTGTGSTGADKAMGGRVSPRGARNDMAYRLEDDPNYNMIAPQLMPQRQAGGEVQQDAGAGEYLVNEVGPELFIPSDVMQAPRLIMGGPQSFQPEQEGFIVPAQETQTLLNFGLQVDQEAPDDMELMEGQQQMQQMGQQMPPMDASMQMQQAPQLMPQRQLGGTVGTSDPDADELAKLEEARRRAAAGITTAQANIDKINAEMQTSDPRLNPATEQQRAARANLNTAQTAAPEKQGKGKQALWWILQGIREMTNPGSGNLQWLGEAKKEYNVGKAQKAYDTASNQLKSITEEADLLRGQRKGQIDIETENMTRAQGERDAAEKAWLAKNPDITAGLDNKKLTPENIAKLRRAGFISAQVGAYDFQPVTIKDINGKAYTITPDGSGGATAREVGGAPTSLVDAPVSVTGADGTRAHVRSADSATLARTDTGQDIQRQSIENRPQEYDDSADIIADADAQISDIDAEVAEINQRLGSTTLLPSQREALEKRLTELRSERRKQIGLKTRAGSRQGRRSGGGGGGGSSTPAAGVGTNPAGI